MTCLRAQGGMEEMGQFYDHCLETLCEPEPATNSRSCLFILGHFVSLFRIRTDPPGVCGTFCNQHTFECFLEEVHMACCDEGGGNCDGGIIPESCPVGCAIIFPEFLETCRDHVSEQVRFESAAAETISTTLLSPDVRSVPLTCRMRSTFPSSRLSSRNVWMQTD